MKLSPLIIGLLISPSLAFAELETPTQPLSPDAIAQIHADAEADAIESLHAAAADQGVKVAGFGDWFSGWFSPSAPPPGVAPGMGRCEYFTRRHHLRRHRHCYENAPIAEQPRYSESPTRRRYQQEEPLETPIRRRYEEEQPEMGSGRCRSLVGYASYYNSGRRTANGERFNRGGMTAAHRTLPMGTRVTVTNLDNPGRSRVVRINDRGPASHSLLIDLAQGAAFSIGMYQTSRIRMTYCLP